MRAVSSELVDDDARHPSRALRQRGHELLQCADARFVLAYHYIACGHPDAARKQYEEVVKLLPNDQLSAQLLKLVQDDPAAKGTDQPTPQPPDTQSSADQPVAPQSIDAAKIVGNRPSIESAKRRAGAVKSG